FVGGHLRIQKSRYSDCRNNQDDCNHDHQFDQSESFAMLHLALSFIDSGLRCAPAHMENASRRRGLQGKTSETRLLLKFCQELTFPPNQRYNACMKSLFARAIALFLIATISTPELWATCGGGGGGGMGGMSGGGGMGMPTEQVYN